jgi:ribosomal protein S18 acetylase RimI-like enzyme
MTTQTIEIDGRAIAIGHAADTDTEALAALWERTGLTRPWNDPHADIALARRGPHSTILVARDGGRVLGSAMVGHDGHRGWVYYLAVEPELQGRGLGKALLRAVEDWLRTRAVPKLMLLVRPDNEKVRGFYASEGYVEEPRIVFSRRLDGN